MSKKYIAGCMNKIGIFYPMFRGTEDECFYFAKKFSFCQTFQRILLSVFILHLQNNRFNEIESGRILKRYN